jgi:hypothetical protein
MTAENTVWLLRVARFNDDDLDIVLVLVVPLVGVEVLVSNKSPEAPRQGMGDFAMATADAFRWYRRHNLVSDPIMGLLALSTTTVMLNACIPARKCKEIMNEILILDVVLANVVVSFCETTRKISSIMCLQEKASKIRKILLRICTGSQDYLHSKIKPTWYLL